MIEDEDIFKIVKQNLPLAFTHGDGALDKGALLDGHGLHPHHARIAGP